MASVNNASENYFSLISKEHFPLETKLVEECFNTFDLNRDGKLDKEEWMNLAKSLFSTKSSSVDDDVLQSIFKLLDEDQVGFISEKLFQEYWTHWFKQILSPKSALVIVDVQNDFIRGSLAIKDCPARQDGEPVVPVINSVIDNCTFDLVVYSCDWHPKDHISFLENVKKRDIHHTSKTKAEEAQKYDTVVFSSPCITEQQLWPAHCVQDSWGAELHPDLKVVPNSIHVRKGTDCNVDSYSAFWDNKKLSSTTLLPELLKHSITDVYVCGLAYDVCVGSTAMHSLEHGFRTVLIEDCCRGVSSEDIESTRKKLLLQGAVIVQSDEVRNMVDAKDRRAELGYYAAMNVAMARKLLREEGKLK